MNTLNETEVINLKRGKFKNLSILFTIMKKSWDSSIPQRISIFQFLFIGLTSVTRLVGSVKLYSITSYGTNKPDLELFNLIP